MKKRIFLSLTVVLLLLLITACQALPDHDQISASTPSSSRAVLPPPIFTTNVPSSTTTVPSSTTTVPSSTAPATPPVVKHEGYSFVYKGEQPFLGMTLDLSNCTSGYLYWVDEGSTAVIPIVEEEIAPCYNEHWQRNHRHVYTNEDGVVYYVKASEPTNIYRTCREDFSKHELIYTSTHGNVSDMTIDTFIIRKDLILQFVADNKKFMILDLNTGEDHFIMEQYYIRFAMFEDVCTDTWEEQRELVFWGMPTEDSKNTSYFYYLDTGEVEEIEECVD